MSVGGEKSLPADKGESMEKLDKERYLKRVIIVCWIALGICFGIKLFGGNLFEIMCNNENFIKVCDYVDNHYWADLLLYSSYHFVLMYFFILSILGKWKYTKPQLIVLIATAILSIVIKNISATIGILFDIWQVIIMPIIFTWNNKKRIMYVFLGNVLLVVFQLLSMYAKDIETILVTDGGALVSIIFSIDVLIMDILYYIYSNIILEKGVKNG